jgi:branched-chain amino acid transport system ATP-binding protein
MKSPWERARTARGAEASTDAPEIGIVDGGFTEGGARYLPPLPSEPLPRARMLRPAETQSSLPSAPVQYAGASWPDQPTVPLPQASASRSSEVVERPLLELRGVTVTYGQIVAVRDLSLVVGAGEVVALLGANGAGKTTTLRTISGLLRPRSGRIFFDGKRIDRASPERIARGGIAHLPEGRGIFPRLTVAENLRMAAYGVGATPQEYQERLERALSLFSVLKDRLGQLAGTLSGGQQQMLAVGRALVTQPRLLMIDELSFGLAPVVVKQLFALLPAITAGGTAILLVEQFVGQALAVASRAYVLEKGVTTFAGSAAELAQRDGFVESSYLGGAVQRPDYTRVRPEATELLRARVDPAVIRRLRAVGGGRPLPELVNEALAEYTERLEAQQTSDVMAGGLNGGRRPAGPLDATGRGGGA